MQAYQQKNCLTVSLPQNATCIAAVRINVNIGLSLFEISFFKDSEKPCCVSAELQFFV